jgi:succinate dehydrogenase/fumarate reductase-like Fe-S protein
MWQGSLWCSSVIRARCSGLKLLEGGGVNDLVGDMSNFYSQYKNIKPYLQKKGAR